MYKLLINCFRLSLCCVYPIIVFLSLYMIYRKSYYKETIKNNFKIILRNTVTVGVIATIGFLLFFLKESFIYDFDYAGHWQRALEIKEMFFLKPLEIPDFIFNSLNYDIYYSYSIALFQFPIVIINQSYGFFCLGSFLYFYIPTFVLLQILYFRYYKKYSWLPVFIALTFFQMYFCFFDGETECFGVFFIAIISMLTIFIPFDEITVLDNLFINLCGFILIFGRRFYLYILIALYLCYFIHFLKYHKFKVFNKKGIINFLKILLSGIVLLVLCITVFEPFFIRVITNDYGEAYAYNNKSGKLMALLLTFSVPVIIVSLYGLYNALNKKENIEQCVEMLFSVFFSSVLFWRVQSFEMHHYYMIALPFIVYYTKGVYCIFEQKYKILKWFICLLLVVQAVSVFLPYKNIPYTTYMKRTPKIYPEREKVQDFANYLTGLTSDGSYIYMATGDGLLNYSYLRNIMLPSLKQPNFIEVSLDLRDGFPINLQYCKFLLISNPITYASKDNQKIYDVITNAVNNVEIVKDVYELVYTCEIHGNTYSLYHRTGDFTKEIKQYFYDQMISYYPNNIDRFTNILN